MNSKDRSNEPLKSKTLQYLNDNVELSALWFGKQDSFWHWLSNEKKIDLRYKLEKKYGLDGEISSDYTN